MKSIFLNAFLVCQLLHLCLSYHANIETAFPFFGEKYGEDVPMPRTLLLDEAGDILVVSESTGQIFAISETTGENGSTIISNSLILDRGELGLNHGLTFHEGYLYASSISHVYRWPYVPGQQTIIEDPPQIVVHNIPAGTTTFHKTRSLAIDNQGRLYVHCGSDDNIDPVSSRAKIRRFNLVNIPNGGWDFSYGLIFADGVRNTVAIGFDLNGVLWGGNNAASSLDRPDLGDIDDRNPGEDLNKFNDTNLGRFYGFPYCFTAWNISGYEVGTQFVWPTFMDRYTDEWCQNPENNKKPVMVLPAHEAPMGIHFYDGRGCGEFEGSFPCEATGDAFMALHGATAGYTPTGYRVVLLPMDKSTGDPTGEVVNIIYDADVPTCGRECFRPVSVTFNNQGHLIVSSDDSNELFRVKYGNATVTQLNNGKYW